ncbi:lytic transglycosylase domain-containing protein [Vineibacter terrae]|uniref:Lytic transglycosylase domain-containing protein n=1 Tax=Vineibacter terrae TaxID=2586908 RepID=A0A5C8P7K6_9HYPH|nr:lytic transglycosylase domain-containing protein [Vineibacter terrae]TXL69322.1 lytic transglycosylase domain-containing protein [Vineibacter terrae]
MPHLRTGRGRSLPVAATLLAMLAAASAQAPAAWAQVTILKGAGDGPPAPGSGGPAVRTPGGTSAQAPTSGRAPSSARPPTGGYVPPADGGSTLAPRQADAVAGALAEVTPLPADIAQALTEANKAVDEKRWDDARRAIAPTRNGSLMKYVEWAIARQPNSDTTFAALVAFLRSNPDWPDELVLRRQAEDKIGPETPVAEQMAFFKEFPPLTSAGLMRRLEAAEQVAPDQLPALARESWRNGTFRNSDEITFLTTYGQHLQPSDHVERFDRLMREGRDKVARDLVPKLPDDYRPIAEARLAMIVKAPEVVAVLRAVPAAQQQDGRLLLDRIRYLRRTGDNAGALSLMQHLPATLQQDDSWWAERQIMARDALQAKRADLAYRLVAAHGLKRGVAFAEAEFLAGWIALRWLKKPDMALRHFQALEDNVSMPVSKSRAAYWLGRTHEAARRSRDATLWYDRGAQYGQTFYGQLAAKKLPNGAAQMPVDPMVTDRERQAVEQREIVSVARWLKQIGDDDRARLFLLRLGRIAGSAGELGLSAAVALDLGRPDVAVALARRGVETGVVLFDAAYPVVDLGATGAIERALALALTRQESSFNTSAVSSSGALGLMQLMPDTARDVATRLGQPYDSARLTRDPAYNVALGSQYLSEMLKRFGGSYELALAAYNAGPNRVSRWLDSIGDPRSGAIDMVDWIELIPFRETRNYVQRVMEGVAVYRDRLNGQFRSVPAPQQR